MMGVEGKLAGKDDQITSCQEETQDCSPKADGFLKEASSSQIN